MRWYALKKPGPIYSLISGIVAVLLGVVIKGFVKYRIALSRARKRQQERLKVADEAVMREAKWVGDNTFDQASGAELASAIRQALESREHGEAERMIYDIIGVPADASTLRISEVCLRLAEKYGPDKNPGDPLAAKVLGEIEEIYEALMDPEKWAAYDELSLRGKRSVSFPELKIS